MAEMDNMRMRFFLPLLPSLILLACEAATPAEPPAAEKKEVILKTFLNEFVTLTPGTAQFPASFAMGSTAEDAPKNEKPAHRVQMKRTFALAKHEVTQELYETVIGRNPSRWKGPRNSVEMVSWTEASNFCRMVTELLQQKKLLPEDEVIRLPSEAEWEYACRAGTTTRYSFGDQEGDLKDYAWYLANSKGEDPPVGRKKPNAWGLHDMHGYVWEWCQDAWHDNYEGAPADSSAWEVADAKERVMRGGSWADSAETCRSGYRHHAAADHRNDRVGFRCVKASIKEK
jgi:formylglycine-generating enzyme required for sulfatase activity